MCQAEGIALMPYGVLGQGKFKSRKEMAERKAAGQNLRSFWGDGQQNKDELEISKALEEIAEKVNAKSLTQVAISYHMQKYPYVFPIIGCRTEEQLQNNVEVCNRCINSIGPSSK